MRRIDKDFGNIPARLLGDACERERQKALLEKNKHEFKGPYGHKDVKDRLREIYNCKCAFCETNVEAGAPFQVEHYRPKAKITTTGQPDELGYYWLGYEWSNLLLSCPNCNNHKRNKFPIGGVRVKSYPSLAGNNKMLDMAKCRSLSDELQAEQPHIINPEITDPAMHLFFWFDGVVRHRTPTGEQTITICNLNRDSLVGERKAIYDDINSYMLVQLAAFDKGMISQDRLEDRLREALRRLKGRTKDLKKEYTACTQTYWTDFDAQFLARLANRPDWQLWVQQAYQDVVNEA